MLGEARVAKWGHASPAPALHRPTISRPVQKVSTVSLRRSDSCVLVVCRADLQTRVREDLTTMERAPTRAFSCLNAPNRAFKTLLRDKINA